MLKKKDVDRILLTMLRSNDGVSDLNFTAGKPLQVESSGELIKVVHNPPVDVLTPYQTEMLTLGILGGDRGNYESLVKSGSADCAYELGSTCRFRVNVFQQRKQFSLVLRKLETEIMNLEQLGLPAIFKDMGAEKNGLILVTGSTGSGKSTTLAALLNEMNETRAIHILTIEDPIEYVHPHKMATFNQRELGTDFDTFHSSLRAALRQAPKVILIGEMRDRATVEIGLAAASTGHLVLSTLHSIDCGQTINRIVGMFDKEEEDQIRAKLAECLRFVVNQRLLPRIPKGRVPSQEIMGMNLRTRELVLNGEGEGKSYYEVISVSRSRGWQTHDQSICDAWSEGKITEETAIAYGSQKAVLSRMIDAVKQKRGIVEDDGLDLKVDTSRKKTGDLIQQTWPGAGDGWPLRCDMGKNLFMVAYEPEVVNVSGTEFLLIFGLKVQGEVPGITVANPKGECRVSAQCKGSAGPKVSYTEWKLNNIEVGVLPLTKKLAARFRLVLESSLPAEIELPNTRFTEAKQKALVEIAKEGRLMHINQLKGILEKAIDEKEQAALTAAIKSIQERAV